MSPESNDIRQRPQADDTSHWHCPRCDEDVVLGDDGACLYCGAQPADADPAPRWSERRSPRRSELNAEARFQRAQRDPAVREIRSQFDDWPLSLEEAARWIEAQERLPIGLPLSYIAAHREGEAATTYAGEELWLIARTADQLARANDWHPAEATALILCGFRPADPQPIIVDGAMGVGEDQAAWRRVTASFDPDEDVALIVAAIKDWKVNAGVRQRNSDDVERQIALHEHVVIQGSSGANWKRRHPKWRYASRQAYSAAAKRAKIADPGTWPNDATIPRLADDT